MDELLLFTSDEPFTPYQSDGLPLTILIDELSPQHSWTSSLTITIDEPFTALQADGLPPIIRIDEPFTPYQSDGLLLTISIDELSPQLRWTSSYYLRLTSPSLHFKQTGSLLLFALTSPLLHISQTGSFLQFLLMSSPLNSDGRALTIYD